jgi:hypothetical protein
MLKYRVWALKPTNIEMKPTQNGIKSPTENVSFLCDQHGYCHQQKHIARVDRRDKWHLAQQNFG